MSASDVAKKWDAKLNEWKQRDVFIACAPLSLEELRTLVDAALELSGEKRSWTIDSIVARLVDAERARCARIVRDYRDGALSMGLSAHEVLRRAREGIERDIMAKATP